MTLIGLVDKAKLGGPPGVRSWVGVSLMAFLTTDVGRTAGSYPIIPGGIGSSRLLAPQWVRYGPAVPGGYLRNRTDLAQVGNTYRQELQDRLRLREVCH